ncbi:CUB and zona pellucida-like domain-containing protein 1 [Biomphalaria pfeifferi]|uniref:CUB and zona pellucida-like domain-containing protein 1 n=1 Tax=Biomphalaria pfeifferi TaxID=112525 RepID=A0AAD8FIJ5_BIOPF|nr:CUB and zona pellucida-like domain-containing protein 1 [Biomphalaria pfeifferi]
MEQLTRTSIIRIFIMLMVVIGPTRTEQLQCQSKVLGKKDYGKSCSYDSECETGICSNFKCSCHNLFFYDNCSQTCIKNCNNSLYYSESSNLAAGLIVSADSVNPPGTKCLWEIYGWPGSYLTLVIEIIDMNPHENVTNWVQVLSTRALLLDREDSLKRHFPRTLASESGNLRVYYSTTFSGYKGFRALYYIYNFNAALTNSSGYIISPGFPNFYEENRNFTWLISGKIGQVVTLRILNISLHCPHDFVNMYDRNHIVDPPLASLCDRGSTFNITSTTNNVFINFRTDGIYSRKKGFVAYYSIHGQYGDYCTSADQCPVGLVCNATNKCDCSKSEKYDLKSKICKKALIHGEPCGVNSEGYCLLFLECIPDSKGVFRCLCPDHTYFDIDKCHPSKFKGVFHVYIYMCVCVCLSV